MIALKLQATIYGGLQADGLNVGQSAEVLSADGSVLILTGHELLANLGSSPSQGGES
jgi:hypothetical protein